MTETTENKARRLLAEGCLLIRSVDSEWITASIESDNGHYDLGLNPNGWWCTCPNRTRRCSHLVALQRVTVANTQRNEDHT